VDDPEAAFAARQGMGFATLARGVLQVTGADARSFLNGLATNDIQRMTAGLCLYAALLDHRGRSLADLWVYDVGTGFLVDLDAGLLQKVKGLLEGGRVSEDVQVLDRSPEFNRLSVLGGAAPEKVESLLHVPAPDLGHWAELPSGLIARTDSPSRPAMDLFVEPTSDVVEALAAAGGVELSTGALEILRLESGRPRYGVDFDEETILLEAGLGSAVSFTKGCYVGQEVISRVANRGHLRRALVSLLLEPPAPLEGAVVTYEGSPVGRVTSAAWSHTLGKTIAFANILSDLDRPGTTFMVLTPKGPVAATIVGTPAIP